MNDFLQKLQTSNRKAAKLERLVLNLIQERGQLLQEIVKLKDELSEKENSHSEIQEKYEALKLVKSMGNHHDKEAVQATIEEYIKEIDICLKNFGD